MKSSQMLRVIREGGNLSLKERIKLALYLSIPAILAQMITVVMEYIDAAMVGRLGEEAGAAIGIVSTSTWLLAGVTYASVSGFTIQISQCIGAKRFSKTRSLISEAFAFTVSLALALCIVGVVISPQLPVWLGGGEEISKSASDYFRVFSLSLPVYIITWLSGGIMQAGGNMKIPGILESLSCLFDVVFNFFFIYESREVRIFSNKVFMPGLGLGVKGAALGTLAANAVTAVLMLLFLYFKMPMFKKGYSEGDTVEEEHGFDFSDIKKAVKLSTPIALERIAVCGAMILVTAMVAPLGNVAVAANSFAVTAEGFCYMPGYGIEEAAATLVGQSIGAKRYDMAYSLGRLAIILGMIVMAVTGIAMFFLAPAMMGVMTPVAGISVLGAAVLRIEAIAEPFYGASIVATGVLRGAGDTAVPAVLNLISLWCVRITLSLILVGKLGLIGIWTAMCLELIFRGIIFLIRFRRKRWLK